MQLYFIRHAQSENNALWARTQSSKGRLADPPLTELGRQQGATLGTFLAQPYTADENGRLFDFHNHTGFGFTHVYCSMMVRAMETASFITNALNLPLVARDDLHEIGGIWQEDETTGERVGQSGKGRSELQSLFPNVTIPDHISEAGWWQKPHENRDQALERAQSAHADLLANHFGTDDRVAIVSHGAFYQRFLAIALGIPPEKTVPGTSERRRFGVNNVSITRLAFTEEGVDMAYQNRTDFLPRELITF